MTKERMMILKMIENGTITSKEGVDLLNALNKKTAAGTSTFSDENIQKATDKVGEFANNMTKTCSDFVENAKPTVTYATKTVVGKVANIFSDLSSNFNSYANAKVDDATYENDDDIFEDMDNVPRNNVIDVDYNKDFI